MYLGGHSLRLRSDGGEHRQGLDDGPRFRHGFQPCAAIALSHLSESHKHGATTTPEPTTDLPNRHCHSLRAIV